MSKKRNFSRLLVKNLLIKINSFLKLPIIHNSVLPRFGFSFAFAKSRERSRFSHFSTLRAAPLARDRQLSEVLRYSNLRSLSLPPARVHARARFFAPSHSTTRAVPLRSVLSQFARATAPLVYSRDAASDIGIALRLCAQRPSRVLSELCGTIRHSPSLLACVVKSSLLALRSLVALTSTASMRLLRRV